jgi:hypothetical protein
MRIFFDLVNVDSIFSGNNDANSGGMAPIVTVPAGMSKVIELNCFAGGAAGGAGNGSFLMNITCT